MRPIEFRARKIDGSWVTGGGVWTFAKGKPNFIPQTFLFGEDEYGQIIIHIVDPETVGQFTGLLDKNGKKVFEGDIVAILGNMELLGTIKWEHGGFIIHWKKDNARVKLLGIEKEPIFRNCDISLEVIANIWENPELMEQLK